MINLKNDAILDTDVNPLIGNLDSRLAIIENDFTTLSGLVGGGSLSTTSQTLIGAINEIHDGYLPLTGGSMTGPIKFKSPGFELNWTAGGEDIILQLKGAESFGSRYFEGNPDVWTFSAGGNANSKTGADFAIKGDGTCQIRGSNIITKADCVLNQSITSYTGVTSIAEYLRYSRFGRVVIIDIGGVTFNGTGTGRSFITGGIPIIRTRTVIYLLPDNTNNNAAVCMYGAINGTSFNCHVPSSSTRYYGQAIYLTD